MPLGKLPSALPPYDARRDLLSFPTRRSSDLGKPTWALLLVAKEGPKQKPELVVAHQLGNAWDIRSLDTADGAVAVWSEGPGKSEGTYEGKLIRAKNPAILIADYASFTIPYAWTGKEVEKIWLSD